jgi:hypothetical protein
MVKKFPYFMEPKCLSSNSYLLATCPYLQPDYSRPFTPLNFLKTRLNIKLLSTAYIFQVISFPPVSHQQSCIHIYSTHSCYKLRPSHFFYLIIPTTLDKKQKFLSSSLCRFIYSPVFTLLGITFSNTCSLGSSFKTRDQVSHQYQTAGKIYLRISCSIYVCIATWKIKDSAPIVRKNFLNSVCS